MTVKIAPLVQPTVGDVIAFLKTQRADAPFLIEDADTNWTISIIHVEVDAGEAVWFSGKYEEMGS